MKESERHKLILIFEDIATVLIILMTGWISVLFGRVFRRSGEPHNLLLSAAFAVVAVYKLVQFTGESLLAVKALAWMDDEVLSEGLIVLLAIVVILVLAGYGSRRRLPAGR